MRYMSVLALFALLLGLAACGGKTEALNSEPAGKFTLSDAEIDAFEASPERVSIPADGVTGGPSGIPPLIFAQDAPSGGKSASVVAVPGGGNGGNGGGSKCKQCKSKCGKCTKKVKSCKCKGSCKRKKDKCSSCKDSCGKCSKQKSCSCHGKCHKKCGKCQDKCQRCSKDGNCGCKGKCKKPCTKCKPNCRKCQKDRNCGCKRCDCRPCPCTVKCKGIRSVGEANYTMDCETGCADATYKVRLTFNDCPGVDNEALGHEVGFFRNGVLVGTATTDSNGVAWLTDECLEPGYYNIKALFENCVACFDVCVKEVDCCEVECTGMTSSTAAEFEADCETLTADATYSVQLTFTDCPDVVNEAEGREVVFWRNGSEVGSAVTNASGIATFTEQGVGLGDHTVEASYEGGCETSFEFNVWEDCCEVICTGMVNDTERFHLADCFGNSGDVFLRVQLEFSECPGEPFDKSGHEVVFTGDGQELGTVLTDDGGFAEFTWQGVGLGNHHITAVSDHCGTEFDVTVHDECAYHACISGKGKLPGKNGDPYMVFQYEGHVQDGHLEQANTMSLADGDISFTNVPIEWIVVLGLEIYFGNDNIMFHTIDNGKAPGVDFCEVWVFDRGYHNSGLLINGQIRSSWGLKKPPVAVP